MKINIRMTIEIDAKEWADTYMTGSDGYIPDHVIRGDAEDMYGEIAAENIRSHDLCRHIITINGKMQPTI